MQFRDDGCCSRASLPNLLASTFYYICFVLFTPSHVEGLFHCCLSLHTSCFKSPPWSFCMSRKHCTLARVLGFSPKRTFTLLLRLFSGPGQQKGPCLASIRLLPGSIANQHRLEFRSKLPFIIIMKKIAPMFHCKLAFLARILLEWIWTRSLQLYWSSVGSFLCFGRPLEKPGGVLMLDGLVSAARVESKSV